MRSRSRPPEESPLAHPALLQHDEAFLIGLLLDDTTAHAVDVASFFAALGDEDRIQDGQMQARPCLRAGIARQQRVAILHVGRHHRDRQPVALGVRQRNALAADQPLGSVLTASFDALDALRVDDRQARFRSTPTAALPRREEPHQAVKQTLLDPVPEPAVDRPPGGHEGRTRHAPPPPADAEPSQP